MNPAVLRQRAEHQYAAELEALRQHDDRPRPPQWQLSPQAVLTYLLGGTLPDGTEITAKYIGSRRLMEIAVATLATDRALLLLGVPGTAKSWVSEHLSAAISGDSGLLVQGTAGTSEDALRYGWNYAMLLAKGPSPEALVPSPMLNAMQAGKLCRIEELTRIPADVQDTLITILSEKTLPVPELGLDYPATKGFNVIATANNRDKGVNELSSALKRRFNTVILPPPASIDEEVRIVEQRVRRQSAPRRHAQPRRESLKPRRPTRQKPHVSRPAPVPLIRRARAGAGVTDVEVFQCRGHDRGHQRVNVGVGVDAPLIGRQRRPATAARAAQPP